MKTFPAANPRHTLMVHTPAIGPAAEPQYDDTHSADKDATDRQSRPEDATPPAFSSSCSAEQSTKRQARYTPGAPTNHGVTAHSTHSDASAQRLQISLLALPQYLLVQGQVRNRTTQARILRLQPPQPLPITHAHVTIRLALLVVYRLRYAQIAANICYRLAPT